MMNRCFFWVVPLFAHVVHAVRHKLAAKRDPNEGASVVDNTMGTNASMQWSPCPFGMCWAKWGAGSASEGMGYGGNGNKGCKRFFGGCRDGANEMDCYFGVCPKYFGTGGRCVSTGGCRSYCDVAHKDTCLYTGPVVTADLSTWMSEFSDVPLNKLLMVEAHHALSQLGTLDFQKPVTEGQRILEVLASFEWIPGFGDILNIAYASLLPMFSSTQSSDVPTLLKRGIRALDLRPYASKRDGQLHDHHGGQGPLVEPAIKAVSDFLKANPSEVIVLNLQNIKYDGDGNCLDCSSSANVYNMIVDMLTRHLGTCSGSMLACNADVSQTVGALAGQVIVHSNSASLVNAAGGMVHHSSSLYAAPWHGKNELSDLRSRILSDSETQSKASQTNVLIGHQWILTPKSDDFIGAVTQRFTGEYQGKANSHACQSLACFGEVASAKSFQASLAFIRSKYARSNILMLDFADRAGTMEMVLQYNRQYARA